MRIEALARVALLSSLALSAVAQTIVPESMLGIEGGGGTSIPFGGSLACRYQCIYDASELPWTGPRMITGISVRPDFNNGNPTPAKGFLEISVLVSTSPRTSATASATFEENYGTDAVWVIENRIVQLPAQPTIAAGPRPANIDFTFDTPWAYGLTPVTNGMPAPDSLLVEIWIKSQPSGVYRIDNLSNCNAPMTQFGQIGPACASGGNQVQLTSDASMLAGNGYSWHVSQAPASMPFFVFLNLTDQGGLLGNPAWPLPYPMFDPNDPTQPSQALQILGWPAPDCYINVDLVASLGGVTDASGSGTVTAALPPGTQYVGTTFYSQAMVFAPTANPLRFISSLGHSSTVCGPLGVARIFQFYDGSASPPPPPPAAGNVSYGVGMVIEVD